jgi:E3 ubiquitin-protein ligase SspH2
MAHGPDTYELLNRIENITNNILDVSELDITSIPSLVHYSLTQLWCQNTNITKLPTLPDTLLYLDCGSTQISSLSELPSNLEKLWCYNTHITELPPLPKSLKSLYCSHTKLSQLPELPDGFQELVCDYTNINEFPILPLGLKKLYFDGCSLSMPIRDNESLNNYITRWNNCKTDRIECMKYK